MMNAEAFNRLLQQPSLLKETSLAELEQLAYQYPWFGTAHLLVAAKKQLNNAADADQLIQKAAVYTAKPLWFRNRYKLFTEALGSSFQSEESNVDTDETDAAFDALAVIEAEDTREKIDFVADETAYDATIVADAAAELEAAKQLEAAEMEAAAEAMIEADAEREVANFISITDVELAADAAIEADAERQVADFIEKTDVETAADAAIEADNAKEALLAEKQAVAAAPAAKEEPLFTFEPFYAVDYFASQGIKLQEDKLGSDQLGKQVKSFTQWLRSMKKIYVEEKKELDSNEEQKVVVKATESNQLTDVVTETMAEVLAKQGKNAQAIDLYRKLSLLHPEKSVYFASRIEELK